MEGKEKYFMSVLNKNLSKTNKIWGARSRHKFVICCRATSIEGANDKIALQLGLDKKTFTSVALPDNYCRD